ncbi:hypothetical protein RYH80_18305 [Halobaculum sp. MBLA0147]|uniref:hypothetical protein n=1 Tax=Halobaculum sp. MBLA0147 TaxID=3079934 RepID=UPI00352479D7
MTPGTDSPSRAEQLAHGHALEDDCPDTPVVVTRGVDIDQLPDKPTPAEQTTAKHTTTAVWRPDQVNYTDDAQLRLTHTSEAGRDHRLVLTLSDLTDVGIYIPADGLNSVAALHYCKDLLSLCEGVTAAKYHPVDHLVRIQSSDLHGPTPEIVEIVDNHNLTRVATDTDGNQAAYYYTLALQQFV